MIYFNKTNIKHSIPPQEASGGTRQLLGDASSTPPPRFLKEAAPKRLLNLAYALIGDRWVVVI